MCRHNAPTPPLATEVMRDVRAPDRLTDSHHAPPADPHTPHRLTRPHPSCAPSRRPDAPATLLRKRICVVATLVQSTVRTTHLGELKHRRPAPSALPANLAQLSHSTFIAPRRANAARFGLLSQVSHVHINSSTYHLHKSVECMYHSRQAIAPPPARPIRRPLGARTTSRDPNHRRRRLVAHKAARQEPTRLLSAWLQRRSLDVQPLQLRPERGTYGIRKPLRDVVHAMRDVASGARSATGDGYAWR